MHIVEGCAGGIKGSNRCFVVAMYLDGLAWDAAPRPLTNILLQAIPSEIPVTTRRPVAEFRFLDDMERRCLFAVGRADNAKLNHVLKFDLSNPLLRWIEVTTPLGGCWTGRSFALCMSLPLLLGEWRDIDASQRRRKNTQKGRRADAVSNEGMQFPCAFLLALRRKY